MTKESSPKFWTETGKPSQVIILLTWLVLILSAYLIYDRLQPKGDAVLFCTAYTIVALGFAASLFYWRYRRELLVMPHEGAIQITDRLPGSTFSVRLVVDRSSELQFASKGSLSSKLFVRGAVQALVLKEKGWFASYFKSKRLPSDDIDSKQLSEHCFLIEQGPPIRVQLLYHRLGRSLGIERQSI